MEKASYKVTKSNALNDIGALETELKKAILGHSELIKETAALSQISEKIIQGAKYKSLRNVFDFNEALKKIYAADRPEWLEYIIKPFFTPKLVKSFSIKSIDNLLTLKTEDKMAGEKIVKEASVPDFKYDDELMDERTGKNFAVIFKELLERITRWDKVSLKEFNAILEIKFGEEIFENRDFYAFLVHLAGKKRYDMRKITEKQDTMLEEMIVKYMPDSDKENFKDVVSLEIYSCLITGQEVSRSNRETRELYEEFYSNAEVYEITTKLLKKLNLNMYEYNDSVYITAGEGNRVFGYTNDDMKRMLGLRLNKELYMVYFIIYMILLNFYQDSASFQVKEFIKPDEALNSVTEYLSALTADISIYSMDELVEESFKTIALLWDELPVVTSSDKEKNKASKASRTGYVKLTFNFLVSQKLFIENEERYYPTDRFKALAENYFEEYKGKIYSVLGGDKDA